MVSPREVNGNGLGLNGEAPNEQRSNHIPLSMVAPSPARSRHPSATADGPLIAERPSDDAVVTKLSAAVSPTTSDQSASAMFVPGINPTTGYKHWAARSGTLIANLLMCAGGFDRSGARALDE